MAADCFHKRHFALLVGIDPNDNGEEVSEEEIRMMLEAGNEKGTFDEEEVEMIQNVFAFDDTSVEEVCTHRVDVVMLDMDDDMTVWEETIQNSRFTYYPISGEDDDDIIGVLDTKDFFRLADRSRESVMANAVDKPYFVPETVKADVLLTNMKRERKYFAILLDEYGGLSGIITLRDISSFWWATSTKRKKKSKKRKLCVPAIWNGKLPAAPDWKKWQKLWL